MSEENVLTKEIAEQFVADEDSVDLEEFTAIEDAAAESLSKHEGTLYLEGLTSLSDAAAESLSKHKGDLCLGGLTRLSDAAAESLGKCTGDLTLDGLTSLSDVAAESLSKHEGTVCNVGAGTGSYEPDDREVVAVEPSQAMIEQRTSKNRVECATAESLPFPDGAFDAAMAIMSVHHWENPQAGLAEMQRVAARQIVFTFDPNRQADLWLVRDYLPEILELEQARAISIEQIVECLPGAHVETVSVPWY
jgi:SAM-dependent methyltransferase